MVAPGGAAALGNEGGALRKERGRTCGQVQIEGRVGRRDHAQQARVQRLDLVDLLAHQVRYKPQVNRVVDGDSIGEHRRIQGDVVEAVLLGMVGDDDGGQNFGHVVLGFAGQLIPLVKLPEVGIARSLHGVLHIACAVVIGGHGQVPIAQFAVDEFHVAGVGARGFLGIETLVDVGVAGQAVVGAGHELPHAAGLGFAIDRLRLEA